MKTFAARTGICLLVAFLSACGGGGGGYGSSSGGGSGQGGAVQRWNRIAVDASGLDHTAGYGEQLGPTRSSRAMAIVHIAIFDAVNSIAFKYHGYLTDTQAEAGTSMEAAVAEAAHDTLAVLFTKQIAAFDAALTEDLAKESDAAARDRGIALGKRTAEAILNDRAHDGSDTVVNYVFSDQPGHWRVDPLNPGQTPLGANWKNVRPFVMTSATQFRVPPPPAMTSIEYRDAFNEVKQLGADGVNSPSTRTADETDAGIFWAYDGTPSLCAPPRLYNQISVQLALDHGADEVELARLLALVNVSLADAGIAIWESKFFYNLWRPITGIREADAGTGPTGEGDGNPETVGDVAWTPMGAPASNTNNNSFTPPFPSYPSGHAGFGGALFQTLRNYYGTDSISFTFVSDELNGITHDVNGNVRPLKPRSYDSLSQAELENGRSRIFLGIHWGFDCTVGIGQGQQVADQVFNSAFRPR